MLTEVGEEPALFAARFTGDHAQDLLAEFGDAFARGRGSADDGELPAIGGGMAAEIDFVLDEDRTAFGGDGDELLVQLVDGSVGIDDDQHEVGVGHGFARFLDANAFSFIQRLANAGGIDEMHGNAAERDGLGDEVASGSGNRGDDGAIALDESIEEAGFPDVGTSDDGEGQALMYDLAKGEAFLEFAERFADFGDASECLLGRHHGDIVVGEIDSGFEHGDQIYELLLDGLNATRD